MAQAPVRPSPHRRSARARRLRILLGCLLGVALIGAVAGTGLAGGFDRAGRPAAAPDKGTSAALPFDLPDAGRLRTSGKLVFAHYFTPYPLSLDNEPPESDYYSRNYLKSGGEKGKHAAYGGLLRDRPLPTGPRAGDWERANLEQEVRTARDAGIDGFSVDILSLAGPNRKRLDLLLEAAHAVDPDFRIMLMPDMTSLRTDPATLANALAEMAKSPAAHRLADGRLVVSPFKAEAEQPAWWSQVMDHLSRRGIRTALVPVFLDFRANAQKFAPISHGFSEWGNRSYTSQGGSAEDVSLADSLGKLWMQPVSVQDARPNQGVYDEAGNTATLRASWHAAIDDGADWVQLTTWNDYSEGTQFAPSLHNGYTYLDLSSYYLTRFKTGAWPKIVRDTVYLTSRVQYADSAPAAGQWRLMRLRPGSATSRDSVEALTFLKAPATLTMTVGSDTRTARVAEGVHATLVPLGEGNRAASLSRGGATVASVRAQYPVKRTAQVQDLQYYGVSSGRTGTE
ncbi:glycoside hydrolase family 71 protein [Streptomyces tsukubensis]|uniref:Glycosyl hydrolase family 71 n=1 Tax=Streptomyces tsukubensis TaxID=83656 RepID=A0A1V4A1U9_9ACTN|nr:glycoside hydrolase family 71 protein [Streptomyces tsukubensis]OON73470.1 hypothetical protein B1H18_27200 [Streptomyces tsukubensis]QFR96738.1 hypothetical protein GBW32_31505 [Streptomyces tsukubensis]